MRIAFFDTKAYDRKLFDKHNVSSEFHLKYFEAKLSPDTAQLARGYDAVCAFVNDELSEETFAILRECGVKAVVMRCAGYNNVDLRAAEKHGLLVFRVPVYSPYAVAEHTMALLLAINRKVHKAYIRTRDFNFTIRGLMGVDLHGKTAGIIGTGNIGQKFIDICKGFGMKIIASDPYPKPELGVTYVELETLLREADVVSLHCPLTRGTYHIINKQNIGLMKPTSFLLNTSRGALIETEALIEAIKTRTLAGAGLDVYEEESEYFFEDFSNKVVEDDELARLVSFSNVIVTSHQGYFTQEALEGIVATTLYNFKQIAEGRESYENLVHLRKK